MTNDDVSVILPKGIDNIRGRLFFDFHFLFLRLSLCVISKSRNNHFFAEYKEFQNSDFSKTFQMFRKPADVLLQTKSFIKKKDANELRKQLQFCFKNYTAESDKAVFCSSDVGNRNEIVYLQKIELLRFKTGVCVYKDKTGEPLIIMTKDGRYYPTGNKKVVFLT